MNDRCLVLTCPGLEQLDIQLELEHYDVIVNRATQTVYSTTIGLGYIVFDISYRRMSTPTGSGSTVRWMGAIGSTAEYCRSELG